MIKLVVQAEGVVTIALDSQSENYALACRGSQQTTRCIQAITQRHTLGLQPLCFQTRKVAGETKAVAAPAIRPK